MTALTHVVPGGSLQTASAAPVLSAALQGTVERVLRITEDQPLSDVMREVPEATRQEARRALGPLRDAMRRPTLAEWEDWLVMLASTTANPPTQKDFPEAVQVLAGVLDDVPVCLLTPDSARSACRHFTFWPRPPELLQWLEPRLVELRQRRRVVELVASAKVEAVRPVAAAPTPEQVAANFRVVGELRAAALGRGDPSRNAASGPGHLSDERLLATYEAIVRDKPPGWERSVGRANVLRERLAARRAAGAPAA